jgi:hypothetical protein
MWDWEPEQWDQWAMTWGRRWRKVQTIRFLELEAVEATECGQEEAACYTGPYGTNDHEGEANGQQTAGEDRPR